ncbi:MAG TPA: hypothetical protein VES91_04970 [Burkholderiaceae bacterium]|nr:hypothetical protein [Burkholderiaceae bacterium]
MLRLILAVCLAAAPLIAAGQPMIYKVQMPDGSVLYSDSVPSGGKVLEEREAKSTPRVATPPNQPAGKGAPAQAAVTRPGSTPVPIMRPGVPTKGAAPPENISALERELAVAKRKLELGREPLPGERRGLAGGGSRLTPEYESRIAAMEREVAATEARLKRAYEAK